MRGVWMVLFLGLALAQTPAEILARVEANLKTPWQAVLRGSFPGMDGKSQALLARLYVLPQEEIVRVEFSKPEALADHFTVLLRDEVWNYIYLTNQLIKAPRDRAQIQGLGLLPVGLGDLSLLSGMDLRLLGEVGTPQGPAYRLKGVPKEAGLGFREMEIHVLKGDPRPVRLIFRDEGKVLADLEVAEFRRSRLTREALLRYPKDAQVVRR
ncbi:MAG: outer membrane lipoprotein carrier protein LolA [Thermaceae bacterium]